MMKTFVKLLLIIVACTSCTEEKKIPGTKDTFHTIEINDRVQVPEEGLLFGNGDLSVSIYQNANHVIWNNTGDVANRLNILSHQISFKAK